MNSRLSEGKVVCTWKRILGFAGLASLSLLYAGAARAQMKPAQPESPATRSATVVPAAAPVEKKVVAQNPSTEPSSPGGHREGITVHGHWTIEVLNPDGHLVRHLEFENSLVPNSGTGLISGVLGGVYTIGQGWIIELLGSPQPCASGGQPFPCNIGTTGYCSACGGNISNNLTLQVGNGIITLNGSIPAGEAGQISTVQTANAPCAPTVAPASCNNAASNSAPFSFTSATNFPGAPISVSAGQTIAVTVAISF